MPCSPTPPERADIEIVPEQDREPGRIAGDAL